MAKLKYKSGNTFVTNLSPIKIIQGSQTTSDNVQIMNDAVKGYIENVTYTFANDNAYAASDYSTSSVGTYVTQASNGGYRGDEPNGVSITLSSTGNYSIIDTKPEKIQEIANKSGTFTQYGFTPNSKAFYNHIKDNEIINNGVIYPTGQVRMFKTNTTYSTFKSCNARDLGGWTCDGGTIKYGKIIRGCRLNGGHVTINENDRQMFRELLGIKYEIDLRGDGTNGSSEENIQTINGEDVTITWSVFGDDIGYHNYPIRGYKTGVDLSTATGTASAVHYKNALLTIIDNLKKNNPVFLHCMAGADRTGTMSFIIEAICGVSRSDLDKDYEMTSFCNYPTSGGTPYTGNDRHRDQRTDYQSFIKYFFDNYQGNSFRDRVINWCLAIGLTYDNINDLRNLLIDGNPSPINPPVTTYTISSTLSHVTLGNNAVSIEEGQTYTSTVTPDTNYEIDSVTVTMGGNTVANAYDSTNNTITVSNVTGNIAITASATEVVVPLPNILTESFIIHGTTYPAVGFTDGKRISASTGAETSDESCFVTGFIPIVDGDKIIIKGVTFPEASSGDGKQYLGLYDENKSKVLVITIRLNSDGSPKTFSGAYTLSKDTSSGNTTYTMTIGLGTYNTTDTTGAKYARISCIGTGENAEINLNE